MSSFLLLLTWQLRSWVRKVCVHCPITACHLNTAIEVLSYSWCPLRYDLEKSADIIPQQNISTKIKTFVLAIFEIIKSKVDWSNVGSLGLKFSSNINFYDFSPGLCLIIHVNISSGNDLELRIVTKKAE